MSSFPAQITANSDGIRYCPCENIWHNRNYYKTCGKAC